MIEIRRLLLRAWHGVIGGIAGGVVFGVLMAGMNVLPMVGMLVGIPSAFAGFAVHMAVSIFVGGTFGLMFGGLGKSYPRSAIAGVTYGVVWWVLGPLTLMPTFLGMGIHFAQAGSPTNLASLAGHILFGFIAGLVFHTVNRRASAELSQTLRNRSDA